MSPSKFPDAFRYYKPRNQKVSGIIMVSKDNKILLVKGRQRNKWSFPKGHLKFNETIHQCALRECFEETGISLNMLEYNGYKRFTSGEYFIYKNVEEFKTIIHDNHEISDIGWYSIPSMMNLRTNIDVSSFLKEYNSILQC